MKRMLGITAVLALALGFAACGGSNKDFVADVVKMQESMFAYMEKYATLFESATNARSVVTSLSQMQRENVSMESQNSAFQKKYKELKQEDVRKIVESNSNIFGPLEAKGRTLGERLMVSVLSNKYRDDADVKKAMQAMGLVAPEKP